MNISPASAPLEAHFQLNKADNQAFQTLARRESNMFAPQRVIRLLLAVFVLVFVASIVFHRTLASRAAIQHINVGANGTVNLDNVFALLVPIGLFVIFFGVLLLKARNAQSKNPMFTAPTSITLEEQALTRQCGAFFNRIEWHGIARVVASDTHLILMISPTEGFIVPRRAFALDAEWQHFVDFARQQWQRAQPTVPPIANI